MDNAFLILCALLLNGLLGGPRWLYVKLGITHILSLPARKLRDVERKLNREHRPYNELKVRGYVVVAVAILVSLLLGWIGAAIFSASSRFAEIFLLALFLPVRQSLDVALDMRRALGGGNLPAAREILAESRWRHHAVMDEHALARASIETLSVNFSEKLFAPVFWYLVLGLPAFFVVYCVNVLHDNLAASGAFGTAARGCYNFIHWLPARLSACLWVAASAFLPEGDIKQTAKTLWAEMMREFPQALALFCMAYSLKLSLAGPASVYADNRWIGTGTPKASPTHIGKALYLFSVLMLLLTILLGFLL